MNKEEKTSPDAPSEEAVRRLEASPESKKTDDYDQDILIIDQDLSPQEVAEILKKRTRGLAQVPEAEEAGESFQAVVFSLGEETYAIKAIHVESIYPLRSFTPVPCTPDFVIGVVNLRGRILSVVDIHRFVGLENIEVNEEAQIIAVNAGGLEVGILTNEVRVVRNLSMTDLRPTLPTASPAASEYTLGVTSDLVVLLDLEALLRDNRMVVWEEVA